MYVRKCAAESDVHRPSLPPPDPARACPKKSVGQSRGDCDVATEIPSIMWLSSAVVRIRAQLRGLIGSRSPRWARWRTARQPTEQEASEIDGRLAQLVRA